MSDAAGLIYEDALRNEQERNRRFREALEKIAANDKLGFSDAPAIEMVEIAINALKQQGARRVKINELRIESGNNGKTNVQIWSTCYSIQDVDDTIAWLNLAKSVIRGWEKINAKVSRASQAATGQNETPQPREVQSKSQVA